MNVLASLLALGLLIVIHEAGHFLAARLHILKAAEISIRYTDETEFDFELFECF